MNRYVQGDGDDGDARTSLDGFRHFATSTWRNAAVIDFLEWLAPITSRSKVIRRSVFTAWICITCTTPTAWLQPILTDLTRQPPIRCDADMAMLASAIQAMRPRRAAMTLERGWGHRARMS